MNKNIIVVDDFYNNAMEVREMALSLNFGDSGNYPGSRSEPATNEPTKQAIESLIGQKIENWHDSGRFQICTANERSWVHSDFQNEWAGIIFLSPEAPLLSGTSFYQHKDSKSFGSYGQAPNLVTLTGNKMQSPPNFHFSDPSKWNLVDKIGNKFNRLVLFKGSLWHISDPYFGDSLDNGRLFQLFFMSSKTYA